MKFMDFQNIFTLKFLSQGCNPLWGGGAGYINLFKEPFAIYISEIETTITCLYETV